ncbi:hypothetical protein NDU88_008188 [Pleurodeles waltl]|uniref:Uncharacterized protein n=1 Tax=Pleurodeles waltl TaxID=8319 RepID=A0AAV7P489_PLEWA|nr:hypothetical protein NDU88_008188 [Pleurodeles waltl]
MGACNVVRLSIAPSFFTGVQRPPRCEAQTSDVCRALSINSPTSPDVRRSGRALQFRHRGSKCRSGPQSSQRGQVLDCLTTHLSSGAPWGSQAVLLCALAVRGSPAALLCGCVEGPTCPTHVTRASKQATRAGLSSLYATGDNLLRPPASPPGLSISGL